MNTISPRLRLEEPLPAPPDDGIPNFRRARLIARRHLGLLLLGGLAGLGLALVWIALARPSFEAHAMVLMRRPAPVAAGMPEGPDAIPDAQLRNELEVLRSKELAAEVIARLGAEGLPGAPGDMRAREDYLRDVTRVSRLEESYIFIVDALGPDPETAARIANATAEAYVARREAALAAAAAERRRALEAEVSLLRAQVTRRQAEIVAAARDPGKFDEALLRRGELEQLLDGDRAAYGEALSLLRAADREADPNLLRASVLSEAVPPSEARGPKSYMILTLGLFLGLAAGSAIALARENCDDTLRTGDEARRILGQPFLGYLPRLPGAMTRAGLAAHPVWRVARDHPSGRYAETLRFARARAEARHAPGGAVVLGFAAARRGEGTSLAAANLAFLLAAEGARVLLIDADLSGAGLGATFGPRNPAGLAELLAAGTPAASAEQPVEDGGFAFLPGRVAGNGPARRYVEGPLFEAILAARRGRYDFILVDLPALEEVAHARALPPLLDGWVAIARWGATPGHALRAILRDEPALAANLLGIMISNVTPEGLARYTPHVQPARDR